LLYEKSNKKKITVETARNYEGLLNKIKAIFPNDDVLLKINPNLIAGLKILINNEKQLDFSLKSKLDKILK
jgi:F0F1-type ATP synthase delta subunit